MINPVGNSSSTDSIYAQKTKIKEESQTTKDENGVLLEIGTKIEKSTTYKKPSVVKPKTEEIAKLWKEAEKATESLRHLVEKLIGRQVKNVEDVFNGKEALKIDAEAKAEAEQLLSEDGELGVKQTSQRIVEFAKAISNGDKSKIPELRDAIKKGFDAAAKILGDLPDISKKTYDEVISQLDKWEKEEE